jgi:hypothetical protein
VIDQSQLDEWFTYHPPREGQPPRYQAIRDAAKRLAAVIVANTAPSPDQTAAVRMVRESVMTANAGIACEPLGWSVTFVAGPVCLRCSETHAFCAKLRSEADRACCDGCTHDFSPHEDWCPGCDCGALRPQGKPKP